MARDIHGTKRGPNEPCWCGSGLKYKKCHRNREEKTRPSAADVVKTIYKARDHRNCSCPHVWKIDCNGEIVRAHSLSKKQALGTIAENGHVFSLSPNWARVFHQNNFEGQLVGVNQASTFTGFCGKHDQSIFSELDNEEFNGSIRPTFLSAYRTLCRELFAKIGQIQTFESGRQLDKGRSEEDQLSIQMSLLAATTSARAALKELQDIKVIFDDALLQNDFSSLNFRNYYFESPPDLVAAGGFNPSHNLRAEPIQDLRDIIKLSENVCFSMLPTKNGIWASFLWPKEYKIIKTFVLDLDLQATKLGTIYGLALTFTENCFLRPSAWQALSPQNKREVSKLAWMGVADDNYRELPPTLRLFESLYPTKVLRVKEQM